MAPSERQIIATIHTVIEQIYSVPENRDNLTVRAVRDAVEPKLGLTKGFLTQAEWKEKSKKIIKEYAQELIDKQEAESDGVTNTIQVKPEVEKKPTPTPTPTKEAPAKKVTKRAAQESKAPPQKRQKKEATPSEDELSELSSLSPEESDDSESEFDEDSDAPKRKRNSKSKSRTPIRRGGKKKVDTESDEEEEEDPSDETELSDSDDSTTKRKSKSKPKPKAKAPAKRQAPIKRQSKSKAKVESSDEEEDEDESPKKKAPAKRQSKSKAKVGSSDEEEDFPKKSTPKKAPTKKETPKKAAPSKIEPSPAQSNPVVSPPKKDIPKKADSDSEETSKPAPDAGSESEMSIVLDEAPKPKRKRRSKADMQSEPKESKGRPKSASGPAKPAKDLSPDEATIKTLQSQLKKCGVNKIWQFELKQYGDDSKEKIRHLQKVLKEIGMSGRFSEARAREIKEMRELQADLEAVKEGEKSWGLGGGRRASRAAVKAKSFRESSGSGEDEGGDRDGVVVKGVKEESEDEQPVPRRPRARADLAFLDDDDESD
ncbi:hypothetical protein N431DRAFT_413262 [Stipitochalara longipes BDJ]|nr:hypothetical protein N431DRAFT_413262 [Stipitochalara longipes BDJ]